MKKSNRHISQGTRHRRKTPLSLLAATALLSPLAIVGTAAAAEQPTATDYTTAADSAPTNGAAAESSGLGIDLSDLGPGDLNSLRTIDQIGLYTNVSPVRVLDTRGQSQSLLQVPVQKLNPNEEFRVNFRTLSAINPNDVLMAVALNITITNADANGYVTAYPCGKKPTTSTVNVQAGRTFANAAIVSTLSDASGSTAPADVCFSASIPLDLLVDLTGYYSGTFRADAYEYLSVRPIRVFDTRNNDTSQVAIASGKRTDGSVIEIDMTNFVDNRTPKAVEIRLTTVNSDTPGFVVAYPCASGAPATSTVNLSTLHAMTNGAIIPVDPNNKICVRVSGTTNVLMDMSGYYTDNGLGWQYSPTIPQRALDTRPTELSLIEGDKPFANNTPVYVGLGKLNIYEVAPKAVVANVTTVNARGPGFLRSWSPGATEPSTSIINYQGTEGRASSATLGIGTDSQYGPGVTYFSTPQITDVIIDVNGYFFDGAQIPG